MRRPNILAVSLLCLPACSPPEPLPEAWQGSYAFVESASRSADDRDMLGTAFRVEPERVVFDGHPARPFFDDMPDEWRVVGWKRGDIGLCQVELRAGERGMGLDFIGEPSGASDAQDVGFTFTVEDATGAFLKVRGGRFRHLPRE